MNRIIFPTGLKLSDTARMPETGKPVGELQVVLSSLKLDVHPSDIARKEMGASTLEAVKAFQASADLPADGKITPDTVIKLNNTLAHNFVADSKTRTQRLQEWLEKTGQKVDPAELKSRKFGASTEQALKAFQAKAGLAQDGRISEQAFNKLHEEALMAKLNSKTQIAQLQNTLLRALDIAKLNKEVRVDAAELKSRQIGPSTQAAIRAVQAKYKLPVTGTPDATTIERLNSISTSIRQPVRQLKAQNAATLKPLKKAARLNVKSAHVADIQSTMAYLGYKIDESEFKAKVFGKTTREAIVNYQKSHGLAVTGHVADTTLKSLNAEILKANPAADVGQFPYRVRGSVRNNLWVGVAGVTVQIWEKLVAGEGVKLAEQQTAANGFFDITYKPPVNTVNKQIKQSYNLEIKVPSLGNMSKLLANPTQIAWTNFTQGDQPYRGVSAFQTLMEAVSKVISPASVASLVEKPAQRQISGAAQVTGLTSEDVMQLVLAHLIAAKLNHPPLSAEVCYAYIAQALPASLPGDLIDSTEDWALINNLVDLATNGLVFMDDVLLGMAFDNAVTMNLMPIAIGLKKNEVIAALVALKQVYVLEKPILIGNGNLKALLDGSNIIQNSTTKAAVATTFLKYKSFGPDFWADLNTHAADFGGATALNDLKTTIEVSHITKSFEPMLTLLKKKIADTNDSSLKSARDLAKLTHDDWVGLINANSGQVPANTDHESTAHNIHAYAATLMSQSEKLFPAIALVATVARSVNNPLSKVKGVQDLLDNNPDFDLGKDNLDIYVTKNNVAIDEETLGQARVIQRVHRIAPTAIAGQVLLDNNIHNSSQIVAMSKNQFVATMNKNGAIDARVAATVYGNAEFQYAQVLQRITDYRADMHRADPVAIVDHNYSKNELPSELVSIPDLELLFGSLDFCECSECQSVYGAAAYLTDILRFLSKHPAEKPNTTVQQVLFERRPDIGNIKLNCENTDTPMPYIDLVCEILENAVSAPTPVANFSFQTTREAAELRAVPEHVREATYDKLRLADFPLNLGFDFWQEQTRVFMQHLGVARWQLMETFQAKPQVGPFLPNDTSIAAEYWGMSSHETALIIATADNTTAKQKIYWGVASGALPTALSVAEFMRRSLLSYSELFDLFSVRWINPLGNASNVVIERPDGTCDTELQQVINLTANKLDQLHRFLRLWRPTSWAMWEIDLLIRSHLAGDTSLDDNCLVHLKQFDQLQKRLGFSVEEVLILFADINTETRFKLNNPQQPYQSLYQKLFLNPVIINPVDVVFSLPIASGLKISDHKSTVLAAFGLAEADFGLLKTKLANDDLTVTNLSKIARYALLAQGLKLPVKDLLTLEALSGVANIFAAPQTTLDFIENIDWVGESAFSSAFSLDELNYVLTLLPDSPVGLRDEVIAQDIRVLQDALHANTANMPDGVITSQIAATFTLSAEQAQLLLTQLKLNAKTLLILLQDPLLTQLDVTGNLIDITPVNGGNIYNAFHLLHKVALVITRFKMNVKDLAWILANADKFGLLNLGTLPVVSAPGAALFPTWLALAKWIYFEALYPEPEGMSLRQIFDMAGAPVANNPAAISAAIANINTGLVALTQWQAQDLTDLETTLQLQHGGVKSGYADINNYLRMDKCLGFAKRIGQPVAHISAWAMRDDETNNAQKTTAQQVWNACKAKYDTTVWLEKVTPLEDSLREKKRDALISYLVASSQFSESMEITISAKKYANPKYWRDADDLLKYFLIDVEMCSCQLTSRIKQAISSTQMFVQRCLLGLEQPRVEVSRAEQQDAVSDNSWKQWKWMKSYRIWEANRKIFLYPENWIEPELRDDKSPFFKELESEILQSDITDENAETAFFNYVHKVHEVARLNIVGTYYEIDDTNPSDNLPPDINQLHVIGRTKAQPAVYYYRKFDLNYGEWSAWEKIDLDIQSDQVIPVVYNRRLHLFWLNFMEKPQKVKKMPPAKASDHPTDTPEPPNMLELQLCWSMSKDKGWATKRVSHQKLIHPWQRPQYTYNIKPRYKRRENLLWLDVYISQSPEFNGRKFWDAYRGLNDFVTARHPFDQAARPWHSSSFVFDGDVVDIKMKALAGQYHVLDANGYANEDLTQTDSLTYVRATFGLQGRAINKLNGRYEIAPRLPLPDGMHYKNTKLVNNDSNSSHANVLENSHSRTLLSGAISPFEIVASQHSIVFDTAQWGAVPFIYQDNARSFFIRPEWHQYIIGYNQTLQTYNYNFYPNYHPYTALFLRELNRTGMDGLLNRKIQTKPENYYPVNSFKFSSYSPTNISVPDKTAKQDVVDFERYGAYSIYNWEIFFHAPLMVACKLSQNQRFEESMRWFHYIFDPTNTESPNVPQRYWITKPFFDQSSEDYRKQRIEELLKNINNNTAQLTAWKNNPFKPHLIARYRPVAYQKNVVMKYIDNLIAWGDQLFRRDTIEAINEATTLYVLAYELLGRRPVKVPNVEHADKTYNELTATGGLDPFGNKQVEVLMENFTGAPVQVTRTAEGSEPLPTLNVFYFSIPNNDKLLEYWDKVEDRLFKIRHCMNIQGIVRQLPLFEPPIDPALLVKAAAAGVDIGSVMADISASSGPYRFRQLAQTAIEFCGEVKALGNSLLSALEKYDVEAISLLRSSHEIKLQQAISAVRKLQTNEAVENWAGLEQSLALAAKKQEFYSGRSLMNTWEGIALSLSGASLLIEGTLAVGYILAGALAFIPKITGGVSGFGASPVVTVDPIDGKNFAEGAGHALSAINAIISTLDRSSSMASTMGSYWHRKDEWDFQGDLATIEIKQINKQIAAAQVRLAIAENEFENTALQIEQAQAVDEAMRNKYTNQQLYDWQVRQISTLYFQSYQLAYDMAKRAEKCFQSEIGDMTTSFVQFGYWDSLKKGLLAGEGLSNDIHRMQAAYLGRNARDLEITKHISLAQMMPLSLIALKESGGCNITLPEWLFDLDYPGHYFRRIKTVSISIPSVVGPYTSINCTLSLIKNGLRISKSVAGGYGDPLGAPDQRFFAANAVVTSIATSHGQNDGGMFELNFNDERYLPFEGAGAVSEWRIDLPRANNQFDLATIADVVIHLRYTARSSGDIPLTDAAKQNLALVLPPAGIRLLTLNQDFPSEWYRFLSASAGSDQEFTITLGREHLPFYTRGKAAINLTHVDLIIETNVGGTFTILATPPGTAAFIQTADVDADLGGRLHMAKAGFAPSAHLLGDWKFKIRKTATADFKSLLPDDIKNAYLVLKFSAI